MLKQVQHDSRHSGLDPESVQCEGWTDPETRCHDMNVWKNVVLWFDGIRESAEGSPEQ